VSGHAAGLLAELALASAASDQQLGSLLGLVHGIAREVHRRMSGRIELDELISEGYLALVQCRERYDASQGASLATFAYRRIEGAMLDHARKKRWFDESRYAVGGYLSSMREVLDASIDDSGWEGASRVGADARWAVQAVGRTAVVSLARRAFGDSAPEGAAERGELLRRMRDCLEMLPEQDRHVLRRLWIEGWSLSDLGGELGVSKEYARRLNVRALDRMRRLMGAGATAKEGEEDGGQSAEKER
jgi:RNA polymerase sigma factor for flagellar operon FliA